MRNKSSQSIHIISRVLTSVSNGAQQINKNKMYIISVSSLTSKRPLYKSRQHLLSFYKLSADYILLSLS